MLTASVAIVGGGLSGLYAAALLEKRGIDYVLLESRETWGGRILSEPPLSPAKNQSANPPGRSNRFDLGGTWYWPGWQPNLARLIRELGLETLEQFEAGDALIDSSPLRAPSRVPAGPSSLPSMRLVGGMAALIDVLRGRLKSPHVLSGRSVRRIEHALDGVTLETVDPLGNSASYRVGHVLLALPPRLAVTTIAFTPSLQDSREREWRQTATWMARHAKYIAVYDEPFWREEGLSGAVRSALGPLVEIHDASTPGGDAALFGFFGVPAQTRARVSADELRSHCRAQLARLFGSPAAAPKAELLKDWARDPWTATDADQHALADHPIAPSPKATKGVWRDRITGIGSEWSPEFPGYIAGAIDAAERGVSALLSEDL